MAVTGRKIVGWSGGSQCAVAIRKLKASLLDLVFPPLCLGCQSELAGRFPGFCGPCLAEFDLFDSPVCRRCGARLSDLPKESVGDQLHTSKCQQCRGKRFHFDRTIVLGPYEGLLRDTVLETKRSGGDAVSLALGELLWQRHGSEMADGEPDVVCAVPKHWLRRVYQGTNGPELIAEALAGHLGVPLAVRLLRRRRNTLRQAGLSPNQRVRNLHGALVLRASYILEGAHVLLVDDIMTTGATCNEAARILRRAGAAKVTVAAVARAS